jgi:hypothetical protein
MPFADRNPIFHPDADLRFEEFVGKPMAAIALVTAVVLTAITWITTFLLTVSSVAAYLSQNAAAAPADKWVLPTTSRLALPRHASAPIAFTPTATWPDESVPMDSPARQVVMPTRVVTIGPTGETPPEESTSAAPLPAQILDSRPEGGTLQPARVMQDHGTRAIAQSGGAAEIALAQAHSGQEQCDDGFWGGICRERVRWDHCHPDKWDTVPECVVQKFGASYSVN